MTPYIHDMTIYTRVHNTSLACMYSKIKTHGSESRGQEEAGRTRRTSELFTRSTAVKFIDTLNNPPLKLSLSYLGLSTF